MTPSCGAEAVRLELTSDQVATCFQDRLLIQPDDFRPFDLSCGGWNRTNIKTFRASHPTVRRPRSTLSFATRSIADVFVKGSGGRNRTYGLLIQSQASLPAATTPDYTSFKSALRSRSAPCQVGSLRAPIRRRRIGRCRSAKGTSRKAEGAGVEPARLHELVPVRAGCHHQLA